MGAVWCTVWSAALTRLGDRYSEIDISVIERGAKTLAACINVHTLSIVASEHESFVEFCALFDPVPIIPGLRHLAMRFTFDVKVFEFVKHHYHQLRSLALVHTHEYPEEVLAAGTNFCSQFSLPLSIDTIECSPFLTPIFVPNSCITDVSLHWPEWDAVDDVASRTVMALTRSGTPVTTVSYNSKAWNIEFIQLAATHLPQLESLSIINTNDVCGDPDEDMSSDTYMVCKISNYGLFSSSILS